MCNLCIERDENPPAVSTQNAPLLENKNHVGVTICEDWKMLLTQRILEQEWFFSLKVMAHFRSKELVEFSTYDTQILFLTGDIVKKNYYVCKYH